MAVENDNKAVMSKHSEQFDDCYYNFSDSPFLSCGDCKHLDCCEDEMLTGHALFERAAYYAGCEE